MVIILKRDYGQLGNRLHTHANILAWCMKNNYCLINLSFRYFSHLFEPNKKCAPNVLTLKKSILLQFISIDLFQDFLDKFCMSHKWLTRFSNIFHVVCRNDDEVLTEQELDQINFTPFRFVLIKAWNIDCKKALMLHGDKIRLLLSPTSESVHHATTFMKKMNTNFDIVIGVHARRGDYRQYLGGKHFHSWELYHKWINQAKKLFEQEGKYKVGFFLCSDQKPEKSTFASLPVYSIPQDEIMLDIHALSLCNYSMGPPSSFGTWAAWFGKVPRCVLESNTKINSHNQFSICENC